MEAVAMRHLLGGSSATPVLADGEREALKYQSFWLNDGGEYLICQDPHDVSWMKSHGTELEHKAALGCQWFAFVMCIIILGIYAWHTWKATSGWEEVYVCCVELCKVLLEIYHEFDSPCTLYLNTGNYVLWLRYGEWLLTCPVILIHLSNITGLKDDYNKRTMRLLISDIGCVVWGITAAMATGYVKWIFFLLGMLYGCNTYFHAAKVYIEAYHTVPKGHCRWVIRIMAWCFFTAWTMFPILFLFGPEGFKHLSGYGSTIAHTVADVLSKQIWTLLGHHLRVKIHEHILIHGNITKTTTVRVGGEDVDMEEMVEADDVDGVNHGTKHLANRGSFVQMRDRLKEKGVEVRASLDGSGSDMIAAGRAKDDLLNSGLEAGRVILAVPDISMVEFFRQQFANLPAPIELVPALGADNTLALVQQAMAMGGVDFVLIHPEFLRDQSPASLLVRLRSMNQRVVAFGWGAMSPMRQVIEASGVDAWLEGPSFGSGIDQQQLIAVLARIQQMKKATYMSMMGMGMNMGGFGMGSTGAGGMGGMMGMGAAGMGGGMMGMPSTPMGMPGIGMPGMGGAMGGMGGMQAFNGMPAGMPGMLQAAAASPTLSINSPRPGMAAPAAMNPLFASVPSQPGFRPATTPGTMTPTGAPPAAAASEAEMLQQLMGEINRLKNELGEQ